MPIKYGYNIWSIPTRKGSEAFGWQPKKLNSSPILDEEEADLECHLAESNEPAPDKHEYMEWRVIKIPI